MSEHADFGRPLMQASCSSKVEHDRQTLQFESSGFVHRILEQTHASGYTVNVVITRRETEISGSRTGDMIHVQQIKPGRLFRSECEEIERG